MNQKQTAHSIRNRLFVLLLRAFGAVVAITIGFILAATLLVIFLSPQTGLINRVPVISRLETYYMARGSWDGVIEVFKNTSTEESYQWQQATLLDDQNRVLITDGNVVNNSSVYQFTGGETILPITVNGVTAGKLIIDHGIFSSGWRIVLSLMFPVFLISIFLAILTVMIGLLLTRSVIIPLAEVIAAAREVASGRLETRVSAQGPDVLRDLSDSFNQMARNLERNELDRRDMLADIAHELRTPLTVLRGRLEGIQDGVYTADEKTITPALESTYLLERLVEDLRLLTLAESRQLHFDKKEVDLVPILKNTIELFNAEANERNISLTLENGNMPCICTLDPQRSEQIFGNLINNALSFVPSGGKVRIILETRADGISITIHDNGKGVPPEDLPYIFNRFWRKEKSRSRVSGGSGLGLAIARQLVEAQDGSINAENNADGGLSVIIFFPAATSE
jgi:two-component system OmpR family sensor kinase/two-component system sensor histidine kinase BaeS